MTATEFRISPCIRLKPGDRFRVINGTGPMMNDRALRRTGFTSGRMCSVHESPVRRSVQDGIVVQTLATTAIYDIRVSHLHKCTVAGFRKFPLEPCSAARGVAVAMMVVQRSYGEPGCGVNATSCQESTFSCN